MACLTGRFESAAQLSTDTAHMTPPTSETHNLTQVLHSDFHRVIHRPAQPPTPGDPRRVTRCRARDEVSVYRLAREHGVSGTTMRAAVRDRPYRCVREPPVRPRPDCVRTKRPRAANSMVRATATAWT